MKRIQVGLVALSLLVGAGAWHSLDAQGMGAVKFQNLRVAQVLDIYKGIAQSELVIASNVPQASNTVTAGSGENLKQDEAARLLEQVLLKQAGVIITRLDGKRASVTYNDRLDLARESSGQ